MDLFGLSGAEFSGDRKHRYALWRIWDTAKPKVMVIGLNPSRADESLDDPTIRRIRRLAASWGFGGIYMLNLFAWVSPFPEDLQECPDPVGANEGMFSKYYQMCEEVVFAWGAANTMEQEAVALTKFPTAKCIGKNKDGSPKHPLYAPKHVSLIPFQ